ncbi:MAG TPA: hypothetical protein DCE56_04945 [Cyanobacteria bacterium UBA8553]|nr:hypothetical protein [Cyanobacteria bacterium UBA8553]HAJ58853.1 hypothetical protein [Cyanobacteria bacterium UBA8543]
MFQKLSYLPHIEYLIIDVNLNIIEVSSNVQKFIDYPDEVVPGKNIYLVFPELIGYEDILLTIIQGKYDCLQLKGIGRFKTQNEPLYLDIYALNTFCEKTLVNQLIIFLEDVTERMVMNQKLVQVTNNITLLLEPINSGNELL